jgi:hypothetical protein
MLKQIFGKLPEEGEKLSKSTWAKFCASVDMEMI